MCKMKTMFSGMREGYQEIRDQPCSQTLSNVQDHQEKLYVIGYKSDKVKEWCFYIISCIFCGIPLLVCHWYQHFSVIKYVKSSLKEADYVLVKDSFDIHFIRPIETVILASEDTVTFRKSLSSVLNVSHVTRFFIHNDIKYVWCDETHQFSQLRGWDSGVKYIKELLEESYGYTEEEQDLLLQLYGRNEIGIRVKSYWNLLFTEIIHPFYVFQLFSVILWSFDDYVVYAGCVSFLTVTTICVALYTTRKQTVSLKNLVQKSSEKTVKVVRRDGLTEEIDSWRLVPGDIIEIPVHGCRMACDALILNGHCIVNESTLTGESTPVTKTPPPCSNDAFDSIILKRHTLFCGTEILQTRYYGDDRVKAVVINTGFSTAKGELVRTILHPKPIGFKFYEDSLKFVCCLFLLATLGIMYLLTIYFFRGISIETMVLDSLDLITIVVPPALPAAMTSGIVYSQARLLKKGIFCVSSPRINVCGKLKLLCFDKTGTLTEGGLELWGVVPCANSEFESSIKDPSTVDDRDPLIVALGTCHSLTRIDGKLSGDPLDFSIFAALDWELEEPGNDTSRYDLLCPTVVKPRYPKNITSSNPAAYRRTPAQTEISPVDLVVSLYEENIEVPYEVGIVREFPFTSSSQCMSVITRILGEDHMCLYCKGAPEKIRELCEVDSLPRNFNEELQTYTSAGFRVLGIAYKEFDQKFNWRKSQRVKREEVEHGLTFLGLVILQNKLKKKTTPVMKELRAANLRCVMITGDNLLTAISVSRDCQMILPDDVIIQVNIVPPDEEHQAPILTFEPIESTGPTVDIFEAHHDYLKSPLLSNGFHYALDGKTWALLRLHYSDLIPKIIVRGTIFARMLPEQKTQLIEAFQELDYIVGMCGDGANDCGAMKAAHIGISLSEAENSVAAPFTSRISDISCVVNLIKEGRCALVSSFVIFKYMAMYSLIQFMTVLILYTKGIDLGNMEFLYLDLVITTSLAVVIGRSGPSDLLVKVRPIARLISPGNLLPLILQIILNFLIQLASLWYLYLQDWFVPINPSTEEVTLSWENTAVFCISSFQYLILALVYSKGKPHREPFYKDLWFMVTFVVLSAFTTLLCVYPFRPLAEYFEIVPVESDNYSQTLFRVQLLMFPTINVIVSFLIEVSIANRRWLKKLMHFLTRKTLPKNKYKQVLLETGFQPYLIQSSYC